MKLLPIAFCLLCCGLLAESRAEKIALQKSLIGTWSLPTPRTSVSVTDDGGGYLVFLPPETATIGKGNHTAVRCHMLIVASDKKSAKRVDYYLDPSSKEKVLRLYYLFEDSPGVRDPLIFGDEIPETRDNKELLLNHHVMIMLDGKTLRIVGGTTAKKIDEPKEVTAILEKLKTAK